MQGEDVRELSGFDEVLSRGVLDVELIRASSFGVTVRIDDNLLSRVRTLVSNRRLLIEVEGGNLGEALPGPHVLVSMPSLRDAELNGSGRLTAEGFDEDEPVSVELSGAGDVSWSGDADELDVLCAGAGALTVEGSASSVHLQLLGNGTLDATSLTALEANIELEGSGSISATVDGRVDAKVDGTGSIELRGDVVRGTWEETGGGTIDGP